MRERFSGQGMPEFGKGIDAHSGAALIRDTGSVESVEFTVATGRPHP